MPLWCRFNKPTDVTNEEEYIQYIYAFHLWKLQDEVGLSFEMASSSLFCFRNRIAEHILRYRSTIDVDNKSQLEEAESILWDLFESLDFNESEWMVKHYSRFQGMKCPHETYEEHLPGEYVEPEFIYYD